jgi:hypothetical protein
MAKRDLFGDDYAPAKPEEENVVLDQRTNLAGVSIAWLATIFRMDHTTVKRRLADCPEVGRTKGNSPRFDVAQAAGYLVKPKVDIKTWIKSLRPSDLPPYMQSEFWDAQNKRQKFEENAGDLWRTDKVIALYAETFKLLKDTMNMWVDNIQKREGLTPDQRRILVAEVDALQNEIYKKVAELQASRKTPSMMQEVDEIESDAKDRETRARVRELI